MKDTEKRIHAMRADKDSLIEGNDNLADRMQTLRADDDAQAVDDMINAKKHTENAEIEQVALQIAANVHKVKIMDKALDRLDGELKDKTHAFHVCTIAAIDKKGAAVLARYNKLVKNLHTIAGEVEELRVEHYAIAWSINRNLGKAAFHVCAESDSPSVRQLVAAFGFISCIKDKDLNNVILNGRAV